MEMGTDGVPGRTRTTLLIGFTVGSHTNENTNKPQSSLLENGS